MNGEHAIEIKNVSKKFNLKYTTKFGGIAKKGIKQVLNDISFNVKKGEILGIIGRNGSGKSTLLKILSGIMYPDSGTVLTNGNVAGILELGMGFQNELTGRENIFIKCGMYGFNKSEIESFIDEIIDFSELSEQIDQPLRTYSSGMIAKLAFSVLINIKCDILVIDEILSVGDVGFNAKCKQVFQNMKKDGKTILLASHNMTTLQNLCDNILWIDEGTVKEMGEPFQTCYHFQNDLTNSFDTVYKLAKSGDVSSQNRLGIMFRDGIKIEKNIPEAEKWLHLAAESGLIDAQLNLAELYHNENQITEAKKWYSKAAELGNSTAIARLSYIDDNSNNLNDCLLKRLDELVKLGNIRATKLMADILKEGILTVGDKKKSIELYVKCAENGEPRSNYILGTMYRDGDGVEKDIPLSIKWFTRASECGSNQAKMALAEIYRSGANTELDMPKAIEWYEIAANSGDSWAMFQLGNIYRDGIGIDKDLKKSEYWFKRYTNSTKNYAEYTLAEIIKDGFVGKVRDECIKWYTDAANNGHMSSAYSLATCYRDGECTKVDSKNALKYYLMASDEGSEYAMIEACQMLLRGEGCEPNPEKAFELIKKSADNGNIKATMRLAELYRYGVGTEINNELMQKMYSIAAEWGNTNALNLKNENKAK